MLTVCIRSYLRSILRHKFLILDTVIPTLYVYVRKGVRNVMIRGYFSKPKGPARKKVWETMV